MPAFGLPLQGGYGWFVGIVLDRHVCVERVVVKHLLRSVMAEVKSFSREEMVAPILHAIHRVGIFHHRFIIDNGVRSVFVLLGGFVLAEAGSEDLSTR